MITLDVQPYCNNCPYFEAKTDHELLEFSSIEFSNMGNSYEHRYVITCQNRGHCEEIVKYLRQQKL